MHLRHVTSGGKNKTYRYAQLVESYRRDDGKPAVRVLKHLGKLPDSVFEAFRIALEASRKGEALVLGSEVAKLLSGSTLANRRYLDLAVLIDCWHQWELSKLLDEFAGDQGTSMSLSELVLPLVLQRCSAPGSKVEATRWVPTTALPEVLGLDVTAFHNSRIHRSLETLYEVTGSLQQRLYPRWRTRVGPGHWTGSSRRPSVSRDSSSRVCISSNCVRNRASTMPRSLSTTHPPCSIAASGGPSCERMICCVHLST